MRLYDLQRWRKGRLRYIRDNPFCATCRAHGRVTLAQVVDHNPPHNNDETKFFDESTWQSLCKTCHDAKTATQDGGFGNAKRGPGARKPMQGCTVDGIPLDRNHHWRTR